MGRFLYSCLFGQSMALGSWVWLVQSFKSKHIFHFRLTFILERFSLVIYCMPLFYSGDMF